VTQSLVPTKAFRLTVHCFDKLVGIVSLQFPFLLPKVTELRPDTPFNLTGENLFIGLNQLKKLLIAGLNWELFPKIAIQSTPQVNTGFQEAECFTSEAKF